VPVIAAVVLIRVVAAKMRGRPVLGGEIIVRCRQGHLFLTNWSALGSLTSIRLGSARFQHCPVGDHWSLVRPVKDSDLTAEDRRMVEQTPLATTGILTADAGNPPRTAAPDRGRLSLRPIRPIRHPASPPPVHGCDNLNTRVCTLPQPYKPDRGARGQCCW
jgi:hypothetical protein